MKLSAGDHMLIIFSYFNPTFGLFNGSRMSRIYYYRWVGNCLKFEACKLVNLSLPFAIVVFR